MLNEARIKLEQVIDILFEESDLNKKPRTYRKQAKKVFLQFCKGGKRNNVKKIRKIVKKLLAYVKRDLRYVEELVELFDIETIEELLNEKQLRELEVIKQVCIQQVYMLENNTMSVENRIVSISQEYVRPIVRGKVRNKVEFGAKASISVVNGLARIDKLEWEAYNEANYFEESVEKYKQIYGYYPARVLADNLYKTRDNKKFCEKNNIQFTGTKTPRKTKLKDKKQRQLEYKDHCDRQPVEGVFGVCKRKFGLGLIMRKRKDTSETQIYLEILIHNISKVVKKELIRRDALI